MFLNFLWKEKMWPLPRARSGQLNRRSWRNSPGRQRAMARTKSLARKLPERSRDTATTSRGSLSDFAAKKTISFKRERRLSSATTTTLSVEHPGTPSAGANENLYPSDRSNVSREERLGHVTSDDDVFARFRRAVEHGSTFQVRDLFKKYRGTLLQNKARVHRTFAEGCELSTQERRDCFDLYLSYFVEERFCHHRIMPKGEDLLSKARVENFEIPDDPNVGCLRTREAEFDTLVQTIERHARCGTSGIIYMYGKPGTGKTETLNCVQRAFTCRKHMFDVEIRFHWFGHAPLNICEDKMHVIIIEEMDDIYKQGGENTKALINIFHALKLRHVIVLGTGNTLGFDKIFTGNKLGFDKFQKSNNKLPFQKYVETLCSIYIVQKVQEEAHKEEGQHQKIELQQVPTYAYDKKHFENILRYWLPDDEIIAAPVRDQFLLKAPMHCNGSFRAFKEILNQGLELKRADPSMQDSKLWFIEAFKKVRKTTFDILIEKLQNLPVGPQRLFLDILLTQKRYKKIYLDTLRPRPDSEKFLQELLKQNLIQSKDGELSLGGEYSDLHQVDYSLLVSKIKINGN